MSENVVDPLPEGTRVRVVAEKRPPVEVGRITRHCPEQGGYLVRHEDGALFAWLYAEVERAEVIP